MHNLSADSPVSTSSLVRLTATKPQIAEEYLQIIPFQITQRKDLTHTEPLERQTSHNDVDGRLWYRIHGHWIEVFHQLHLTKGKQSDELATPCYLYWILPSNSVKNGPSPTLVV